VKSQGDILINAVRFNKALYYEFAKRLVYSTVGSKWLAIFSLSILFPLGALMLYISILNMIAGSTYTGERSVYTTLIMSIICLLVGAGLIPLLANYRKIALFKSIPHKRDFFRNSLNQMYVEYKAIISDEKIKVITDGEIEEIPWCEVVGTRQTKHFVLLILEVPLRCTSAKKQQVIDNWIMVNELFIEYAVVVGKNSFSQGDLAGLYALLDSKGIVEMSQNPDKAVVVYDISV